MNAKGDANRSVRMTKRRLATALMTLMQQKTVQEVTVRELTQLAKVSRGTFYFHYTDIYDLLEQIEQSELERLSNLMDSILPNMQSDEAPAELVALFEYMKGNQEVCFALFGSHADPAYTKRMKGLLADRCLGYVSPSGCSPRQRYLTDFAVNGCFGNVVSWLEAGLSPAPAEMAAITWEAMRHIGAIL